MKKYRIVTQQLCKDSKEFSEITRLTLVSLDKADELPNQRWRLEINLETGHVAFEALSPQRLHVLPQRPGAVSLEQYPVY